MNKLSDYEYLLPKKLIAQKQVFPRDCSKLLKLTRKNGNISHHTFCDIADILKPGDILVVNNSKVFPARLCGKKFLTGGKAEIFLLNQVKSGEWEAIGKNLKISDIIIFDNSTLLAKIINKNENIYLVKFNKKGLLFQKEIDKIGLTPLPPYIKRNRKLKSDQTSYQTIYAKRRGSVAAPTAGLHFTHEIFTKLKLNHIEILEITLHVGIGTFAPVKVEDPTKHKMHMERYSVSKQVYEKLLSAKKEKRRIVAVGTTTTRVLEHIFSQNNQPELSGSTDIFIYPGFEFQCIDGLITNFHLPKSTLLMLVSAFGGYRNIKKSYKQAILKNYRFYSYGDAMIIV